MWSPRKCDNGATCLQLSGEAKVNQLLTAELTLVNPLPELLQDCSFTIEGVGLTEGKPVTLRYAHLFTLSPEPSLLYATSYTRLSQDRRCGAQTGSQGQPPVQPQPGRRHRAAGELWQRQTEQHQELPQCWCQRMRLGRSAVAIHFQFLLPFSKMFACHSYFNFSNSSTFYFKQENPHSAQ